jgi:hypothetical protein
MLDEHGRLTAADKSTKQLGSETPAWALVAVKGLELGKLNVWQAQMRQPGVWQST